MQLLKYARATGAILAIYESDQEALLALQVAPDDPDYGGYVAGEVFLPEHQGRYEVQAGVLVARTALQLVADRLTFPANGTAECRITVEPFVACTLHVQDVTGTVAVALTQALDPLILTADVAQPFTITLAALPGYWAMPLTVEAL